MATRDRIPDSDGCGNRFPDRRPRLLDSKRADHNAQGYHGIATILTHLDLIDGSRIPSDGHASAGIKFSRKNRPSRVVPWCRGTP
jgi:hypothetical protein